jgi:hypothetical protein
MLYFNYFDELIIYHGGTEGTEIHGGFSVPLFCIYLRQYLYSLGLSILLAGIQILL